MRQKSDLSPSCSWTRNETEASNSNLKRALQPTSFITHSRLIYEFINILVRANVIDLAVKLLIRHCSPELPYIQVVVSIEKYITQVLMCIHL